MTDHLTAQLNEAEAQAKRLLALVKSPYLRAKLELAVRDVEEARIWLGLDDPQPAIAGSQCLDAFDRIATVQKIVAIRGYDVQAAGE